MTHFNMKHARTVLMSLAIACSLLLPSYLQAAKQIESSFQTIKKNHPALASEMDQYAHVIEQVLLDFLDNNNTEPYSVHVKRMDEVVKHLNECLTKNNAFTNSITKKLVKDLQEMVKKLKSFGAKPSFMSLAGMLSTYSHLIPTSIQNMNSYDVIQKIKHRLACVNNTSNSTTTI